MIRTHRARTLVLLIATVIAAAPLARLTLLVARAEAGDAAWHQIRTSDPRLRRLLREGVQRSATLRALGDRLERSDVVVYANT